MAKVREDRKHRVALELLTCAIVKVVKIVLHVNKPTPSITEAKRKKENQNRLDHQKKAM